MLFIKKIHKAFILTLVVAAGAAPMATVSAGTDSWTGFGVGGKTVTAIAMLQYFPPPTLWVGTDHGVYTNMGGPWIQLMTTATNTLVIGPLGVSPFYAGTDSGVYKSTNSGSTWSQANSGLTDTTIMSLVINPATPTTLYAGTRGGVFKSTNSAGSWSAVNSGLTELHVRVLAINPTTPTTLYAGTDTDLFKSTNGGGSWTDVSTGGTPSYIHSLAIDPVTPAIIYAGTNNGIYRSANSGGSWSLIDNGLTYTQVHALAIDPATPTTIYAGTNAGGVFKSVNSGQTWNTFHTGLTDVYSLLIDPYTTTDVYAGTNTGVFDIEQTPDPFGKSTPVNGSVVSTDPTLTWGTSSGVTSYEYCVDIINNTTCDGSWVNAGSSKSVSLSGLRSDTAFYWQVRAVNANGTTYANGGTWWSFEARDVTFTDVPASYWDWAYIETIYANGITSGCSQIPLKYCPANPVTREQMAVFILKSEHGSSYTPPAMTGVFSDVPIGYWAGTWIEQLYHEGITSGCSQIPLMYCPAATVTREQMAVFLMKAEHGTSYTPPAMTGVFSDVPVGYWAGTWIEQVYHEGITSGCSQTPLMYCPTSAVTRDQMAVFLVKTFHLLWP